MIIRSNSITAIFFLLVAVKIKQCTTIEQDNDNNRIRRTETTNIGSDKMEQTPAITHTHQQPSLETNNGENVSLTQSVAKANQVHDFIMQRSQTQTLNEQQVPENKRYEPQLMLLDLPAPRGRTSKLFRSYQTIYNEARASGPVYQSSSSTTTTESVILTTTEQPNVSLEPVDEETEDEEDTQQDDNANNDINEKINPFLMSAFNFITNTVLSSIKSRQSNLDEGRAHVENKVEELNNTGKDNGSEHIDVKSDDNSSKTETTTSTAVAEGRYIKGDPLNGYYDFVITEGSYKFWIVFQLFTAALIIYSTFAAIYYSKVNPIVSDYEYQDYLGGRSFPEDASIVDDSQDSVDPDGDAVTQPAKKSSKSWFSGPWMQRTQYALQFILDAIEHPPK